MLRAEPSGFSLLRTPLEASREMEQGVCAPGESRSRVEPSGTIKQTRPGVPGRRCSVAASVCIGRRESVRANPLNRPGRVASWGRKLAKFQQDGIVCKTIRLERLQRVFFFFFNLYL